MSAPKLVIVADDLTGAADSAARCVNAGLSAEVWLEASSTPVTTEVVAISTDSRFLPPAEAGQRVTALLATLSAWRDATWYKKIDSTLRGNLGAELEAMTAALPERVAVICPAFPAQGRGLEAGNLIYSGAAPLHLPTLLREQSHLPVAAIGLSSVRQGVDALQQLLQEQAEQGNKLLVVDALRDEDLEVIVAAAQSGRYLLCGSAGLMAPLAARWVAKDAPSQEQAGLASGPILAVVGSGSEMAHAQVAQVAAAATMRVRALDNNWYEMDLIGSEAQPVGDWLLHLAAPDRSVALEGAVARAQAARLADVAFAAIGNLQPATLLIVGGDTTYYVLRRLGIERLQVVAELLPGVPLTYGVDRAGQRRAVVLKAGNFGDAQTLVTLCRKIHALQVA